MSKSSLQDPNIAEINAKEKKVDPSKRVLFAKDEEETKEIAYELARNLESGSIVLLEGDLGAGKTTFVKGIASALGIDESEITSPTFTYLNLFEELAHFDLYRLKKGEDFFEMGFDEYFDGKRIVCIEWPGLIEERVPKGHIRINLTHVDGGRKIEI